MLLDENRTVKAQDPKQWEEFVSKVRNTTALYRLLYQHGLRKVCQADPIFFNYENCWPITFYVEEWFYELRNGYTNLSLEYQRLRQSRRHATKLGHSTPTIPKNASTLTAVGPVTCSNIELLTRSH